MKRQIDPKYDNLIRHDGIEVASVVEPSDYVEKLERGEAISWLKFQSQRGDVVYSCNGSRFTPLHTYSLMCFPARFVRAVGSNVARVARVVSGTRLPLTRSTLLTVCRRHLARLLDDVSKATDPNRQEDLALRITMESANRGNLGDVLRVYGEMVWYHELEVILKLYFSEWYVDVLSCVYAKKAIQGLPIDELGRMVRLAATNPFELCLWTSHRIMLLDDITHDQAVRLCGVFAAVVPPRDPIRLAALVYCSQMFEEIHKRGEAVMPVSRYKRGVTDPTIRMILADSGAVTYIKPDSSSSAEMLVGMMPDLKNEEDVVDAIVQTIGRPGERLSARPREQCWPFTVDSKVVPNPEQVQVIDALRKYDFVIVNGRGGTGKTSVGIQACIDMFPRGSVLVIASTGAAVEHVAQIIGPGTRCVTLSKALEDYRRNRDSPDRLCFAHHRILIIEEASTVSASDMKKLLSTMTRLERVYMFGDTQQLEPVEFGSCLFSSIAHKLKGTPIAFEMRQSMRIDQASQSLIRNLDLISMYNGGDARDFYDPSRPPLMLDYSMVVAGDHPLVFVPRCATIDQSGEKIKELLMALGTDVDSPDSSYMIIVHTNGQRIALCQSLYRRSKFARSVPAYREHSFQVGERVMFCENLSVQNLPGNTKKTDSVANGTIATILGIFDQDLSAPRNTRFTELNDTDAKLTYEQDTRWLCVKTMTGEQRYIATTVRYLGVLTTNYSMQQVEHAYALTEYKSQGSEADRVVLYIDPVNYELCVRNRKGMYTGASRARKTLIVMGGSVGVVPDAEPGTLRPCPDSDFEKVICKTSIMTISPSLVRCFPSFQVLEPKFSRASSEGPVAPQTQSPPLDLELDLEPM